MAKSKLRLRAGQMKIRAILYPGPRLRLVRKTFIRNFLSEVTLVQNSFWQPPVWQGAAQRPDLGGLKLSGALKQPL
jgi:hypothetical protein